MDKRRRGTEAQTQRHRGTERQKDRETEAQRRRYKPQQERRERGRKRERERERKRERERERERARARERERERETCVGLKCSIDFPSTAWTKSPTRKIPVWSAALPGRSPLIVNGPTFLPSCRLAHLFVSLFLTTLSSAHAPFAPKKQTRTYTIARARV